MDFFSFVDTFVHPLDLFLILVYLLGVLVFGIGKGVETSEDFCVAGIEVSLFG